MEGKVDMAARRQVTNKLLGQYRRASKLGRGKILDWVHFTARAINRMPDETPA
ncbi:hypothetical protein MycrhDRAFT_1575 [Mycolicibacterium rhodesiae JS60]|nr:hypothetical protein MycrhDRAFT_1575 [Mycolicibacterium rhodesiae JS60]